MSERIENVAKLRSVTHRYGATFALNDINLSVPQGKMVALIGPDGVGKSTLLGLIAGVRRIQMGDVETLATDIKTPRNRRKVCERIAYMPQGLGHNLYPSLSVIENIDFFGKLYGQSHEERRPRIEELLLNTDLKPFSERPAGKLSGGMKQKLSLCCALIHDPDLLILDEPTTGVDPLSRQQFWELIGRIHSRTEDLSVIVSTAYIEEAERFDHIIAMNAGRIIGQGPPDAILEQTGEQTLEHAFIALLPEAKQRGHQTLVLPPRTFQDGAPAIKAEGLTKRFGDFTAVDNVTIEIDRGEIFGFLGSNGCGKTTTMKMLTGLLLPSAGEAKLWGKQVDVKDLKTRARVGYMSQSFSLYSELTVEQNLRLHARLFHLPAQNMKARIEETLKRFNLVSVRNSRPENLPLGIRQRLQLAVAVIHKPEMLILDEPTSGVDPIARDQFWRLLIELSRKDGVTIFISTHFVNEAVRCDRISLMHAGKLLAQGAPEDLREEQGADTLEEAFIAYLKEASKDVAHDPDPNTSVRSKKDRRTKPATKEKVFNIDRMFAFANRETLELLRDPVRIAFALLGPVILMLAMSYGISFDIDNISYAAFDNDQTQVSRTLLNEFAGSRYFSEQKPIYSPAEVESRLRSGKLNVALVIPPGFGKDLVAGKSPEISAWLDGSNAFRAETTRSYVNGIFSSYLQELSRQQTGSVSNDAPAQISPRFRYNQAFESVNAIAPGILMMLLILVPAMLTALGIVREKEMGSITNLYIAPASKFEFLLGKQLPYIGVAMISFLMLTALMLFFFHIPMKGSFTALILGVLLFTTAATAFGLVVSSFVRSQIAAIFATAIIVMIPTINFSGMMYPVSTLEGGARVMGALFPAAYFQTISAGIFNKGLQFSDLYANFAALAAFCLIFWALSILLLRKQQK